MSSARKAGHHLRAHHLILPRVSTLVLAGLVAWSWPSAPVLAQGAPVLWGAGVRSCADFLASAPADPAATVIAGEGYRRYEEWLAGFVTGLSLATGRDLLQGAALEAAMTRVRANCERHPEEDFFNASVRLLKLLGGLESK